jgi:phenylacetic acid degradation operon negative regulatory protein
VEAPARALDGSIAPGTFDALEPPQSQDLLVTLLGSYVRPHEGRVWSGGLVSLLNEFGFSVGAARIALTRLVTRDLLARIRTGRLIHYRLTPRAKRLLEEGDRRIFSLGEHVTPTDEWTVLWHDLPEEQRVARGRLSRRLRFLGFGTTRDGVWVSPRDREAEVLPLIAELEIGNRIGLLVGRLSDTTGHHALVRRAWDVDGLCRRYALFASEFAPYARKRGRPQLSDKDAFITRTRLVHHFRGFALLDPELPDDLIPDPRTRRKAVQVFRNAYEILAEPAQRHFDEVTSGWRADGAPELDSDPDSQTDPGRPGRPLSASR